MNPDFRVHLPLYEGPLDLLLGLIEKRELDITQLSLAAVTDDYLAYLRQLEQADPARVVDFLVIAARLVLLKSRLLLPQERQPREEDDGADGEALARALEAYRQYKEIARTLGERESAGLRAYLREAAPPELERRLAPDGMALADLLAALRKVIARQTPPPAPVDGVVRPLRITVRQRIAELTQQLRLGHPLDFERVIAGASHRQEIIASFLALLELIKMQRARVTQPALFAPIRIEPIMETLLALTTDQFAVETDLDG